MTYETNSLSRSGTLASIEWYIFILSTLSKNLFFKILSISVNNIQLINDDIKIRSGLTKYFFRDILKDYIPKEILQDRKRSFGTPIAEWLKSSLYNFSLNQFEIASKKNYPINYKQLIADLKKHKEGTSNRKLTRTLWNFLILTIWLSYYDHKIVNFNQ
jgi:asparagine synthetase B (glutamine-hydrolysing)